jgi:hypothetical protein
VAFARLRELTLLDSAVPRHALMNFPPTAAAAGSSWSPRRAACASMAKIIAPESLWPMTPKLLRPRTVAHGRAGCRLYCPLSGMKQTCGLGWACLQMTQSMSPGR